MGFSLLTTVSFLLSPFISLFLVLIGLFRSVKYRRYYGFLLSIAIGILVYYILPSQDMDLYRYYQYLDQLNSFGFSNAMTMIWSASDPLSYSFMFLISHLFGNNFVPLFVSLFGYGVLFYIIFDYSKIKQISILQTNVILIYFLSIFNIVNSLTGVRFCLGISVFFLALYIDIVKKKRKMSLVLYLLAPLFHTSTVTLLLIRFIMTCFRDRFMWLQYLLIFIIGFSTPLLQFVSNILSAVPFLEILSERADVYLLSSFPSGMWYPYNILISVATLIVLLIFYKKDVANKTLLKMNIFILIIALANVMNFYIASRYMTISKLLFAFNMISIASYIKGVDYFKTRRISLYIFTIGYLVVVIGYYGYQYTALKYLNFGNLFPYGVFDNILTIFMNR